MLTPSQRGLLKRAQAHALIEDAEYRDHIAMVVGVADCRSSTDRRVGNDHFDRLMALFEAIYWRQADRGELSGTPSAVFRSRGYWAGRNTRTSTTRDRFTDRRLGREISEAEDHLRTLGKGDAYLAAISKSTGAGWPYLAAMRRTIKALLTHAEA